MVSEEGQEVLWESGDTRPWGLQISSAQNYRLCIFCQCADPTKKLQYTVHGDSLLCEETAGEREPDMHRCMLFFDTAFVFPVFSRTFIFALMQHIGLPVGHHIALHSQYCLGHTVALRSVHDTLGNSRSGIVRVCADDIGLDPSVKLETSPEATFSFLPKPNGQASSDQMFALSLLLDSLPWQ